MTPLEERVQIGARIRSARKRKGISQAQLAGALAARFGGEAENIRRSLVNNEQGRYVPRMRTLEAIADITEQPLDYFRGGSAPVGEEAS